MRTPGEMPGVLFPCALGSFIGAMGWATCAGMSLNKKFPRLLPNAIRKGLTVANLVDQTFKAYNGARLAEACRLFTQKMLEDQGTVGMSLTGALTPAGLGKAAIVPLMK